MRSWILAGRTPIRPARVGPRASSSKSARRKRPGSGGLRDVALLGMELALARVRKEERDPDGLQRADRRRAGPRTCGTPPARASRAGRSRRRRVRSRGVGGRVRETERRRPRPREPRAGSRRRGGSSERGCGDGVGAGGGVAAAPALAALRRNGRRPSRWRRRRSAETRGSASCFSSSGLRDEADLDEDRRHRRADEHAEGRLLDAAVLGAARRRSARLDRLGELARLLQVRALREVPEDEVEVGIARAARRGRAGPPRRRRSRGARSPARACRTPRATGSRSRSRGRRPRARSSRGGRGRGRPSRGSRATVRSSSEIALSESRVRTTRQEKTAGIAAASRRAIWSVTSFSCRPPGPTAPVSVPPCPGSMTIVERRRRRPGTAPRLDRAARRTGRPTSTTRRSGDGQRIGARGRALLPEHDRRRVALETDRRDQRVVEAALGEGRNDFLIGPADLKTRRRSAARSARRPTRRRTTCVVGSTWTTATSSVRGAVPSESAQVFRAAS